MNFLRIILGLSIAANGFMAALLMLIAFLLVSFPASPSPLQRVGTVLILVLIETAIGFATYYAFGKVMGPTPRDDGGG